MPIAMCCLRTRSGIGLSCLLALAAGAAAQTPIAIVPVEGVKLTGAMDVADGKAVIAVSGSITAGDQTATITLPHRGNLRICATTKVSLTSDSTVPASLPASQAIAAGQTSSPDAPGLMVALDRGALEANFATGRNSDVILTPDFRILISGPGTAAVQVRLGPKGDTCVDNRGPNAPYVSVSSVFEGGVYRVQADQRVMFQHGSLHEVVDNEKESCGCPPPVPPQVNAFPTAVSEGLAPLPTPAGNAAAPGTESAQITAQFSYDGSKAAENKAKDASSRPTQPPPPATSQAPAPKPEPKPGVFTRLGHFFRRIFGG